MLNVVRMNNYLLLRNNKETGPFSYEELVKLGLKQYDLVWVEGKSAAWRYPGEIDELKQFAPPVEEQPYDRFYKNGKSPVTAAAAQQQVVAVKQPKPRIRVKAEWARIEPGAAAVAPQYASVIETAPAAVKPAMAEPRKEIPAVAKTEIPQPKKAEQPGWESSWLNWQQEKDAVKQASKKTAAAPADNYVNGSAAIAEQPALETKFTQSLNDIKERYAATVLKAKTKAGEWHRFKSIAILAMLAIPVMCLGVWLGHKWTTKDNAGKVVYAKTTPAVNQQQPAEQGIAQNDGSTANNTEPAPAKSPAKDSKELIPSFEDNNDNAVKPPIKQPKHDVVKPSSSTVSQPQAIQPFKAKSNTVETPLKPAPPQQFAFTVPNTVNPAGRNKLINPSLLPNQNAYAYNGKTLQHAAPPAIKKNEEDNSPIYQHTTHKARIEDFVNVDVDQPYTESIKDLKLNVANIADVPLDLVVIDVEYFDEANRFRNGQTVHIRNIPAGETINVNVPDNQYATRIRYKVSLVTAEEKGVYLIGE
jgi:hypothetical protein